MIYTVLEWLVYLIWKKNKMCDNKIDLNPSLKFEFSKIFLHVLSITKSLKKSVRRMFPREMDLVKLILLNRPLWRFEKDHFA